MKIFFFIIPALLSAAALGQYYPPSGGGSGNVSMTQAWQTIYSDGSNNVVELPLGPEGTVLWSGGTSTNPYWDSPVKLFEFTPGARYAAGSFVRMTIWPEEYDALNGSYVARNSTTNFPKPDDPDWIEFASDGVDGVDGVDGAKGDPGVDGRDGVVSLFMGPWDAGRVYSYSSETGTVVSYGGRWYEAVASSTGYTPTAVGGTNYWVISVDKGRDGTAMGYSNWVDRGAWDGGVLYASNDVVHYGGNVFIMYTNTSVLGTAPSLDGVNVGYSSANWDIFLAAGPRGATGPKGSDGGCNTTNIVTTINTYHLLFTNNEYTVVDNAADTPGDVLIFKDRVGDMHHFEWGQVAMTDTGITNVSEIVSGSNFVRLAGAGRSLEYCVTNGGSASGGGSAGHARISTNLVGCPGWPAFTMPVPSKSGMIAFGSVYAWQTNEIYDAIYPMLLTLYYSPDRTDTSIFFRAAMNIMSRPLASNAVSADVNLNIGVADIGDFYTNDCVMVYSASNKNHNSLRYVKDIDAGGWLVLNGTVGGDFYVGDYVTRVVQFGAVPYWTDNGTSNIYGYAEYTPAPSNIQAVLEMQ